MGIWVNAIPIHINSISILQLSTNIFKVDFFFNILEICEAKFLQENSEVSKQCNGREIEMYKTVLKIAASPEPCHGEEETEQVQASPRQVENV